MYNIYKKITILFIIKNTYKNLLKKQIHLIKCKMVEVFKNYDILFLIRLSKKLIISVKEK